jgi:hypothetical protein
MLLHVLTLFIRKYQNLQKTVEISMEKFSAYLSFHWQYDIQLDIQGDSGGICNNLGNDSVCDSKQKSSYKHGSDFEWLPRYCKTKIRTILRA